MRDHTEEMKENALDFLLFAYFGSVKSDFDSEGKIIEVAIKKAYQDATLEGAYNALLPKLSDDHSTETTAIRDNSKKAYNDAAALLKEEVGNFLDCNNDYDAVHKRVCLELDKIYKDYKIVKRDGISPCFTPGNAQKWVNMTMKYLYIICGMMMTYGVDDNNKDFCEKVFERAQYFHAPIDSYLLEALENIPSKDSAYIKKEGGSVKIKYKKIGDDYILSSDKKGVETTAWSSMEDYKIYQELRDKCEKVALQNTDFEWPIEWESKKWIQLSKARKSRSNRKF